MIHEKSQFAMCIFCYTKHTKETEDISLFQLFLQHSCKTVQQKLDPFLLIYAENGSSLLLPKTQTTVSKAVVGIQRCLEVCPSPVGCWVSLKGCTPSQVQPFPTDPAWSDLFEGHSSPETSLIRTAAPEGSRRKWVVVLYVVQWQSCRTVSPDWGVHVRCGGEQRGNLWGWQWRKRAIHTSS